ANNPHLKTERAVMTAAATPPAAVLAANPAPSGFASSQGSGAPAVPAQAPPSQVAVAPRLLPAFSGNLPEVAPNAPSTFGSLQPAAGNEPTGVATAPPAAQPTAPSAQATQAEQPTLDAYSPTPFNQQMHPNRKEGNP